MDIRWTEAETERLLGVIEDQIDVIHRPTIWAKKAKELKFPGDKHVTKARIKQKLINIKKRYVETRIRYQDRIGFGVTKEDCRPDIASKLEKTFLS